MNDGRWFQYGYTMTPGSFARLLVLPPLIWIGFSPLHMYKSPSLLESSAQTWNPNIPTSGDPDDLGGIDATWPRCPGEQGMHAIMWPQKVTRLRSSLRDPFGV